MAGEQTGPHKHAKKSACITANQPVPGLGYSSACHCPAYTGFPITPWLGCLVTYLLECFFLSSQLHTVDQSKRYQPWHIVEFIFRHDALPEICLLNYRSTVISAVVCLDLVLFLRLVLISASFPWLCFKIFFVVLCLIRVDIPSLKSYKELSGLEKEQVV